MLLYFYSLLKKNLSESGIIVTQSGSSSITSVHDCFSAVENTLKNKFISHISYNAYIPSYCSTWGFVIATDTNTKLDLLISEIDSTLSSRGIKDLKMYDGESHQELFSLPLYVRKAFKSEKRIITDKNPLFIY